MTLINILSVTISLVSYLFLFQNGDAVDVGVQVGGLGVQGRVGIGGGVRAGLAVDGARDLLRVKRLGRLPNRRIGARIIGGRVINAEIRGVGGVSGGESSSRTVRRKVVIEPGEDDFEETRRRVVKRREIEEPPAEEETSSETRRRTIKRTVIEDDGDWDY
ncbi:unnamed protein product [Schistosoma turkestanicum]|nr:unnamed protein product [Schistosoma turkestanicum]